MDDLTNDLINAIVPYGEAIDLEIVRAKFQVILAGYNISKQSHEIALTDDNHTMYLIQSFLSEKLTKGCSMRTIAYYFDNRYTNAITESLNRVSKEISLLGRGYNFKVLRAKILYRNEAAKPAKFAYYEEPKPTQEITQEFVWDNFDVDWVVEEPNGSYIKIEQKTDINLDNVLVSSGTNIDTLMEYFKHNTSQIFQRAAEKRFPDTVAEIIKENE